MPADRLQAQRFELKFQVPEIAAQAIRRHLRAYLVPDEFGADRALPAYLVNSLYLDSPDFQLYQSTVNGDRNRFKLRVRYYDDDTGPVFLEIKRRVDRCILKQRARVHRDAVPALLSGEPPAPAHLIDPGPAQLHALQTFADLRRRLGAVPRAHVAYEREAWCSRGPASIRVTFDRAIRCEPQTDFRLGTSFRRPPAELFPGRVILELKFTDRFPAWLQSLVDAFDLRQSGAAKYVDGVYTLGPAQFDRATAFARPLRPRPAPGLASPFAAARG